MTEKSFQIVLLEGALILGTIGTSLSSLIALVAFYQYGQRIQWETDPLLVLFGIMGLSFPFAVLASLILLYVLNKELKQKEENR